MPTNRTPRSRGPTSAPLTPGELDWLLDGEDPDRDLYLLARKRAEALWREHGGWAVQEFAREHPGRRPWAWWRYDSPKPRARLGGVGDGFNAPARDYRKSGASMWEYGMPALHLKPLWAESLNKHRPASRAPFVAFDPGNPPTYEAEAAYLKRHDLLQPGELQRLTPGDFEPEAARAPAPPSPASPPPRGVTLHVVEETGNED